MNSLFTLGLMIGIQVSDMTVGTTIANLGMTDVKFPHPLFEGDTVHCTTEVLSQARVEVAPGRRHRRIPPPRLSTRTTSWSPNASGRPSCVDAAEVMMRSLLFVPADSGGKLDKAMASGADAVILDLEDSIAPERKAARARDGARLPQGARRGATAARACWCASTGSTPA